MSSLKSSQQYYDRFASLDQQQRTLIAECSREERKAKSPADFDRIDIKYDPLFDKLRTQRREVAEKFLSAMKSEGKVPKDYLDGLDELDRIAGIARLLESFEREKTREELREEELAKALQGMGV